MLWKIVTAAAGGRFVLISPTLAVVEHRPRLGVGGPMTTMQEPLSASNIRTAYEQAVAWYVERVGAVEAGRWGDPGLGEWTVRELVAHGARSITLPVAYLDATATATGSASLGEGPFAYWQGVFGRFTADELTTLAGQVAERGRHDAAALGDEPALAVWTLAEATLNRLADTGNDAVVTTNFGRLTLVDYLPSRVVELVTHGLDLAGATGHALAAPPLPTAVTMAMLTGFGDPARIILALTGRAHYAVLA